jgi:hypothetical protein
VNPSKLSVKLPYLIASNLCSFVFYSRYYNGTLLDTEPDLLARRLLKQLLDKESEQTVEACFESAYFNHLKHLSAELPSGTVKQFQA